MISGSITQRGGVSGGVTSGVGGTTDYTELENKPSINGVELVGNKNAHDLDLASVQDVATLTGQLSDLASDVALMGQKLPKNYSTDEQATGQHWIDGRIIYVKSFFGIMEGDTKLISIDGLNIDKAWFKCGYYDIGVTQLALNEYFDNNHFTRTHINPDLNPPYIDCLNKLSLNANYFITIEYVKNEV